MSELASLSIESREQTISAENLGARIAASADELIARAFAVRESFYHNVDEGGVGIHVYSTNIYGSSGKGGDILIVGDLFDIPSMPSMRIEIIREREQIRHEPPIYGAHKLLPEEEEKKGRLGPLTGAYRFAKYRHDPGISSDHVDADYNWLDKSFRDWGEKYASVLRPAKDGSLETAADTIEARLQFVREAVEAAEARHASAKQSRLLEGLKRWVRTKLRPSRLH